MREIVIEHKLVSAVKAMGGIAPKFVSPGYDGMPDRLILLPGGKIAFVEVKAMGRKPRPLQLHRHEILRRLGFKVCVLDDEKQITPILAELESCEEAESLSATDAAKPRRLCGLTAIGGDAG